MSQPHTTLNFPPNAIKTKQLLIDDQSIKLSCIDYKPTPPMKEVSFVSQVEDKNFNPVDYLQHLDTMFHGKHQYMLEMIEILLQQVPTTSEKLAFAIAEKDWQKVFFQSHRIKSTLKIAGLEDWVNVCLEIESRTRTIVTEELHLISGFFEQFQVFSDVEIPRLEMCVKYLKEQIQQSTDIDDSPLIVEVEPPQEETIFLLP